MISKLKKLLPLLLLVIVVQSKAQVQFPEKIERLETDQPLIDCQQFQGSYWQVDSIIDRDSIPIAKRERGMAVAYKSGINYYVKIFTGPDTSNTNWVNTIYWKDIAPDLSPYQLKSDTATYDATKYYTKKEIHDTIVKYWQTTGSDVRFSGAGRIGIGTSPLSPYKIAVSGFIKSDRYFLDNLSNIGSDAYRGYWTNGSSGKPLQIIANGIKMITVLHGAPRVGINDTVPKYTLDVNGQARLSKMKYPTTLITNNRGIRSQTSDSTFIECKLLTDAEVDTLQKNKGATKNYFYTENGVIKSGTVSTSGGSVDSSYGNILIKRYNKPDHVLKGQYIDSLANATAYPLSDSAYCVFSAGRYAPTVNIARDGFKYHFEAGSHIVKTTAGYLFDYTAIATTKNISITGSGIFDCTYGFFTRASVSNVADYITIQFKKVTTTNATAINMSTTQGRNWDIQGDVTCSGGYGLQVLGNNRYDYFYIKGTHINSTANTAIELGGSDIAATEEGSKCIADLNITQTSTGYPLNLIGGNVVANVLIKATSSGVLAQSYGSYTLTGTIFGNIAIYAEPGGSTSGRFNFTGNFANGTCTGAGTVNNYNLRPQVVFNLTNNKSWNNVNKTGVFINNGFDLTINGQIATSAETTLLTNNAQYAFTTINAGINVYWGASSDNYTNVNISNGVVTQNGNIYLFSRASQAIISGGEYIQKGRIYHCTDVGNTIKISGGKYRLQGGIINGSDAVSETCVSVTDNATFIHEGGVLKGKDASINVANTKTLTIRNYGNYYTNYARGGLGTYTETITGGGTEIVSPNVE